MNRNLRQKSHQELGAKTTESMIWFTTLPAVMHVVRFASSIFLARLLEPRDFGIVGIASILVFYTNNLTNFGLGNAIVQREDINDDHMNTFFTMNLGVSVLLCIGFIISAPWVANFFNMEELNFVIKVFSIIFLITSFYTIAHTKLRRELSFRAIALAEAIKVMISMPLSLLLAAYDFGYWSLILAMLCSTMISTIIICFRAKISCRLRYTKKAFLELYNYASWNFFSGQINMLSMYLDKLIIGKISGATVLGYYEKSFGIAQMPYEQMANKLGTIAFSTFSRCQNNQQECRYYFLRLLTLLTFLSLPIFVGLFSIAEPFVIAMLGDKWIPMIPSFKILLIAFLASSIISLFSTLNISCGYHKQDTMIRFFSLAILGIFLYVAAPYGINVVAYVVLGHNLLVLFLTSIISIQIISLSWKDLVPRLLPAVTGSVLILVAVHMYAVIVPNQGHFINLFLQLVIGFGIYSAWFLLTRFEEWRFLRNKVSKLVMNIPRKGEKK